jgi:hypothetical protein
MLEGVYSGFPNAYGSTSVLNFQNGIRPYFFNKEINELIAKAHFDQKAIARLKVIRNAWNFYEGYHWQDIPAYDKPQTTVNFVRSFVNKFVAFELGDSFYLNVYGDESDINAGGEKVYVTTQGKPKTLYQFLEDVWIENKRETFCTILGQSKSVTGDAWVRITFIPPDELDDPFGEFPQGKIKISVVPTHYVFPIYDPHDIDRLMCVEIKYLIQVTETTGILQREKLVHKLYSEVWTKDRIQYYMDNELTEDADNPYGVIPFVQIKNFPLAGQEYGASDIDDLIPLNIEYNMKMSDVSEIIDYHAAPITVVYGARIGNLEKGANKVWGGLPKDARIQNLETISDLSASNSYIKGLKTDMCEVSGIPEEVLGGTQSISNTSGVAMQYMNLPLIDRTKIKKALTKTGIERINRLIIHMALVEGLIEKPADVDNIDFYYTEITLPDTLPKDKLLELQEIQLEMKLGLLSRKGALERLGEDDVEAKLINIDADMKAHPEIYGLMPEQPQINSGMINGQTPKEILNTEMNGANVNKV